MKWKRSITVCFLVTILLLGSVLMGQNSIGTGSQTKKPVATAGNDASGYGSFETNQAFKAKSRLDKVFSDSFRQHRVTPALLCSDEVFLRRAYLDLVGLPPTANEAKDFLANSSAGKRSDLIDRLLARREFADFQAMHWCDLLRVKAEFPINLWPNGAACYYRWIHRAILDNQPYDRFARELLTASGSSFRDGSANFYRAVAEKNPETLAEAAALAFLGTDIGPWPKEKRGNLAVFFSRVGYKATAQWKEEVVFWTREPLETTVFIFPDGTKQSVDPNRDPRHVFADWLISPDNEAFNRTIVNRVWTWLFGAGLVTEPEELGAALISPHPAVVEYLILELVRSNYDLKRLYRIIVESNVYQQSAKPQDSSVPLGPELFASYPIHRIEAEVLQDVLARLFDLRIGYVSEVPEPYTYIPPLYRTVRLPDSSISSSFLEKFGRASRDTGLETDRNSGVTESQQLFLLNSTDVNQWVSRFTQKYRQVTNQPSAYRKVVDDIYLTLLSRYPTENELRTIREEFLRRDKQAGLVIQDLVWCLLNTGEFLCKH